MITEKLCGLFTGELSKETTTIFRDSYAGKPLACAAAILCLDIFEDEALLESLQVKIGWRDAGLAKLKEWSAVPRLRQRGFIGAIRLADENENRLRRSLGASVCLAARQHGLLTRAIRNVIVLIPLFCIIHDQFRPVLDAVRAAILDVCEKRVAPPA